MIKVTSSDSSIVTPVTVNSGTTPELNIENTGGVGANISFQDNTTPAGSLRIGATGTVMQFTNGSAVRMTIDSTGVTTIGNDTIVQGTGASIAAARYIANNGAATIKFQKSRSGTVGTISTITSGDVLGTLSFQGADSANAYVAGATIVGLSTGTIGTNQIPGILQFNTATSAGTITEAMRLDSSQQATFSAEVHLNTNSSRLVLFRTTGSNLIDYPNSQSLLFRTTTSEGGAGAVTALTLDSSANVSVANYLGVGAGGNSAYGINTGQTWANTGAQNIGILSSNTSYSTSSTANALVGLYSQPQVGNLNTANWTQGTYTLLGVYADHRIVSGATGTISNVVGLYSRFLNNSSTASVTNNFGVKIGNPVAVGTITSNAGLCVDTQSTATNNTGLLLGTATIPSGQFGIYQNDTNLNSFNGSILCNSISPVQILAAADTGAAGAVIVRAKSTRANTGTSPETAEVSVQNNNLDILRIVMTNHGQTGAVLTGAITGPSAYIATTTANNLAIGTNSVIALNIDQSQNVGIGATTINTKLQVGTAAGSGVITAFCHTSSSTSGTTSQGTGSASLPALASGTFTPTIANVSNTNTLSAGTCQWMRVGNVVSVSGNVTVTASNSTASWSVTLPVANTSGPTIAGTGVANGITSSTWDTSSANSTTVTFSSTTAFVGAQLILWMYMYTVN